MTKVKSKLFEKDPEKKNHPKNYRSITCLPIMWKIQMEQIRKEIYLTLISR